MYNSQYTSNNSRLYLLLFNYYHYNQDYWQNTSTDRPQRLHDQPSPSFQTRQSRNCNTETTKTFQFTFDKQGITPTLMPKVFCNGNLSRINRIWFWVQISAKYQWTPASRYVIQHLATEMNMTLWPRLQLLNWEKPLYVKEATQIKLFIQISHYLSKVSKDKWWMPYLNSKKLSKHWRQTNK